MPRFEQAIRTGWRWRPLPGSGKAEGDWRMVELPLAWQRYPGGWNHRGKARYLIDLPPPKDPESVRWLRFDGVQYRCRISCNGIRLGSHEGGWDPFWFALPSPDAGGPLEIEVESIGSFRRANAEQRAGIEQRAGSGRPAGSGLPPEECTTGFLPDCGILPCGIWKEVHLVESASVVVQGARLRWIPSRRVLEVRPMIAGAGKERPAKVSAALLDDRGGVEAEGVLPGGKGVLALRVPSPRCWSTADPYRYRLCLEAEDPRGRTDAWEGWVGLRHLAARGERLLLNGEPVMLRGALHWGYDPETVAPRGDEASLRREMLKLRELGFNLVKHCLYVPHDLYFELADALGMLQWLELPMWLPSASPAFEKRALREFPRIAAAVQHHPSLVLYSLGCELNQRVHAGFLRKLFRSVNRLTPNALLCDNSGSGDCYGGVESGMSHFYDYHFYAEPLNLSGLMDAFGAAWRPSKPWIFGEFCDSDVFRDLEEVRAALKDEALWWLSSDPERNALFPEKSRVQQELGCLHQEERLARAGLGSQGARIRKASLRHSLVHRKSTLETARKYPFTAGYVVTGMRDTPITTSGLFDDLGRSRFEGRSFDAFNGDNALLVLPPPRRAWVRGGDRRSGFDLHHQVGGARFKARIGGSLYRVEAKGTKGVPPLAWRLEGKGGAVLASGEIGIRGLLKAGLVDLGELEMVLPEVQACTPCRLVLSWALPNGAVRNAWSIWIHPGSMFDLVRGLHLHDPGGELDLLSGLKGDAGREVWVSSDLDGAALNHLRGGGSLILVQAGGGPLPSCSRPFWREAIHLVEDHPLGKGFPFQDGGGEELLSLSTDRFFTGRWEEAGCKGFKPILARLDARDFGVTHSLVELTGLGGRCFATTLHVAGGMGDQPLGWANNRAGQALLAAMHRELTGEQ